MLAWLRWRAAKARERDTPFSCTVTAFVNAGIGVLVIIWSHPHEALWFECAIGAVFALICAAWLRRAMRSRGRARPS